MLKDPNFDTSKIDALAALDDDENVTYKKMRCVKCNCCVVVPDTETKPVCLKCRRQEA